MKKIFLAGLVALGMLFAACNNEDIPNGGETLDDTVGYLSLTISSPASLTRTTGTPLEPGVDNESEIIDAVIYFTDDDGNINSSVSVPALSKIGIGTGGDAKYTTGATKVPTGTAKLFVVVNPASAPLSGNIQQVIEGVSKDEATKGYKSGKFMMVSANDQKNFMESAEEVDITPLNTETNPFQASVSVDRMAVKIRASVKEGGAEIKGENMDDDVSTIFDGGIVFKGMVLINGAKKFNTIQQWAPGLIGTTTDLALKTPQSDYVFGKATYVENFYSPISEFGLATYDEDGKATALQDLTLGKEVFSIDPVYALENRPEVMEEDGLYTSGRAVTTGVIYHFVLNNEITFYTYFNKVYTLDELKELDAFKAPNPVPDWNIVEDMRLKGIKVYENGNTYYTYFIKGNQDQNTVVDGDVSYTYYGVLRNSIYNLTINSISGLGDDIPGGGGDPEDPVNPPIDEKEAYINVDVTINPWVLNEIGVDL